MSYYGVTISTSKIFYVSMCTMWLIIIFFKKSDVPKNKNPRSCDQGFHQKDILRFDLYFSRLEVRIFHFLSCFCQFLCTLRFF